MRPKNHPGMVSFDSFVGPYSQAMITSMTMLLLVTSTSVSSVRSSVLALMPMRTMGVDRAVVVVVVVVVAAAVRDVFVFDEKEKLSSNVHFRVCRGHGHPLGGWFRFVLLTTENL